MFCLCKKCFASPFSWGLPLLKERISPFSLWSRLLFSEEAWYTGKQKLNHKSLPLKNGRNSTSECITLNDIKECFVKAGRRHKIFDSEQPEAVNCQ